MGERINISTGTPWEKFAGYSRAVRIGDHIYISGTTASDESGAVMGETPYEQTVYIFKKIEQALIESGATLNDVVRTRMFVTDIDRWEEVAQAHGEVFSEIRPVCTLVAVKALVTSEHLVEIEVDALVQSH